MLFDPIGHVHTGDAPGHVYLSFCSRTTLATLQFNSARGNNACRHVCRYVCRYAYHHGRRYAWPRRHGLDGMASMAWPRWHGLDGMAWMACSGQLVGHCDESLRAPLDRCLRTCLCICPHTHVSIHVCTYSLMHVSNISTPITQHTSCDEEADRHDDAHKHRCELRSRHELADLISVHACVHMGAYLPISHCAYAGVIVRAWVPCLKHAGVCTLAAAHAYVYKAYADEQQALKVAWTRSACATCMRAGTCIAKSLPL